ncbi:MAG TPA: class I SAM-dependent RNA methyltransferase [Dehalococcoidia bacterium]|nr:class I SAM-dependent RNA methyltransferase [Dehalococcoidia bacterium]
MAILDTAIDGPPAQEKRARRRKRDRRPVPREFIRLRITDMAHRGYALGRYDGQVVFAAHGIPGEDVTVEITQRRQDYLVGRVVEVHEASPARVDAPCQYYGRCGGCQLQHIDYAEQLRLKTHIVREQLRRFAHLSDTPVLPAVPCDPPWAYRNQTRFTVWHGALGFVGAQTHRFVRIDECLIADPAINETLQQLQDRVPGARQVMVRVGVNTGDRLLQPSLERFPDVTLPSGQRHLHESLLGADFRVSASSFFQVNTRQAETLVRLTIDALDLQRSDVVLDAYAGVGTFAKIVAPQVCQVIAIEEAASAVDDAKVNLAGIANVRIELGAVENLLPTLGVTPDAAILDPPRTGCHRSTIEAIVGGGIERLVYVSCEPATLARDIALLIEGGYELRSVQPVDMFPQTYHIECVAGLRRV